MLKEKLEGLMNAFSNGTLTAYCTNALGLILTNGEEILFIISTLCSLALTFYGKLMEIKNANLASEREFELRKMEIQSKQRDEIS